HRPERVGTLPADDVDRRAASAEAFLVQEIETPPEEPDLFDFTVPIIVERHKWGTVRVGVSQRRMDQAVHDTRRELLLLSALTLLLGGALAAFMARRIAEPARQLLASAEAISRGDLDQRIEPAGSGELAFLARAFNHMSAQLRGQRRDLEQAHADLRRHYDEL